MRKYCKAVVNIVVAVLILIGVIWLLPKTLVFFSPFVVGWVIALIAGAPVRFLEEKIKIKRKIGSVFVIVSVIALVVFVIYFAGSKLLEQAIGLIGALPDMWSGMESDLNDVAANMSVILNRLPGNIKFSLNGIMDAVGSYMGEFIGKIGTPTIEAAGNLAKQLPALFIGLIMALLSAYFFVADREQLNEWCSKHVPPTVQLRYQQIKDSLVKSVGGYFKAQFKIEVWMYLLLLIGLGVLKVEYFALIALGVAILDLLPFLGTGTVLLPWAVIKLLTADYKMAIGLLIIWGGGQLARQLIQPKIVGDSMGVEPLPTLFLLFIGYKVGGVFGMIFAVPLGILVYSLYTQGAFETTKNSVLILVAGINRFRRVGKEDMFEVEEMSMRSQETAKEVELRREQIIQEKEAIKSQKRDKRKKKKAEK